MKDGENLALSSKRMNTGYSKTITVNYINCDSSKRVRRIAKTCLLYSQENCGQRPNSGPHPAWKHGLGVNHRELGENAFHHKAPSR